MKKKFEVQTSVNRIKRTMLPLIFMQLSDVAVEKIIFSYFLLHRIIA